jgi:hypothetical protein
VRWCWNSARKRSGLRSGKCSEMCGSGGLQTTSVTGLLGHDRGSRRRCWWYVGCSECDRDEDRVERYLLWTREVYSMRELILVCHAVSRLRGTLRRNPTCSYFVENRSGHGLAIPRKGHVIRCLAVKNNQDWVGVELLWEMEVVVTTIESKPFDARNRENRHACVCSMGAAELCISDLRRSSEWRRAKRL